MQKKEKERGKKKWTRRKKEGKKVQPPPKFYAFWFAANSQLPFWLAQIVPLESF
jgi:hypothetical protein